MMMDGQLSRAPNDRLPVLEPAPVSADALTPLPRAFFEPTAAEVARRLLGHLLLRRTPIGSAGGIIVETEAYLADDPACHGYNGETQRNRAMYGPPGRAYVYFIYGNHFCVNAVCREPGIAEAVLIRAIEPVFGLDWMRARRGVERERDVTNGPGKICAALDVERAFDGVDLCDRGSPLFIAVHPRWHAVRRQLGPVGVTPRVGITLAAERPLRFLLEGSRFVSRAPGRPGEKRGRVNPPGASSPTTIR